MRTSLTDVLRLAWHLYRSTGRRYQRIGQLLENASQQRDPCITACFGRAPLFYQENLELIEHMRQYDHRVNKTPGNVSGGQS